MNCPRYNPTPPQISCSKASPTPPQLCRPGAGTSKRRLKMRPIWGRTTLGLVAVLTLLTFSMPVVAAKVRASSHSNAVGAASHNTDVTEPLRSTSTVDSDSHGPATPDFNRYLGSESNTSQSPPHNDHGGQLSGKEDPFEAFDSPDYVLGQNAVDYGRGFVFGGPDHWGSVTMVDGDLEPLEEEEPYFDDDSPTHVTASVGAPAHIPCMVRNLGSKSLSWIRHRDLHVLTVGSFTFANDHRFSAHRDQATGDWVLVLRQPQPTDSGHYVCSISTKPVMTHTVKLSVVVPAAEMVGGREVFLDHGSTLNLTCLVLHSPSPPEFVLWYHRDKLVNYGGRGGRIEVQTVHHDTTTRSSLLVRNATQWNSGRYACKPANARRVTILVHVLKSETPAAMQTTTSKGNAGHALSVALLVACLTIGSLMGSLMGSLTVLPTPLVNHASGSTVALMPAYPRCLGRRCGGVDLVTCAARTPLRQLLLQPE